MNTGKDQTDFAELPTLPRINAHAPLDVPTMSKRVDALCAPYTDIQIAEMIGVNVTAVGALRQGRDIDIDDGTMLCVAANLADMTGASLDWILGYKHAVVPAAK